MNYKMHFLLLFLLLLLQQQNRGLCVDLFFENPDSGFFLKPDDSNPSIFNGLIPNIALGPWSGISKKGGVVDVERFTVLDQTRPALIRATYGPFSTKQTVPARYALPEFPDDFQVNDTAGGQASSTIASFAAKTSTQMELSAHLVVKEVTRARPSVRVLVHGGGARGHHSPHVCVTILIKKVGDVLSASCTPVGAGETGGDATCLVSINIPARWWPPHTRVTTKLPKTLVSVSYLVGTATGPHQCVGRKNHGISVPSPRVTVKPETEVGDVSLILDPIGYDEISTDPLVHVLVPKTSLHPGTTINTPLYLNAPGNIPAIVLVIKCKVRNGTRIVGVEAANSAWNLTVDYNQRKTSASVTAMLIDSEPDNKTLHSLGLHEVFSWVLEIPMDAKAGESKITWSLQYLMDAFHQEMYSTGNGRKMSAKITILKDITQAIVPISKSWSVVNTAVLTGRQVSRALKILSVSHAGNVGDVTLQSSCTCTDKAALKVSTSCTSVYLDGSEVRGSQNATVIATFSHFSGAASFTVWMPEVPLQVHLEDTKLSQIKGWKAPKRMSSHSFAMKSSTGVGRDGEGNSCSILYQQVPVQVYGRFIAIDDNSGRKSYLLSRDSLLRMTELVTHMLRVEDPTIVTLENQILKGASSGLTEIQVLSPIIGHVIGSKEIRVTSDKVWVNRLHAAVISGLSLSLQPDPKLMDGYDAITNITPTLSAKYQEALIDTWVELSDGTTIPLRDMNPDHYVLRLRSLDPSVVAVAPSPKGSQPRIIAIGHGEGELLQVSLELSESCGKMRPTLATTTVRIKIDLQTKQFGDLNVNGDGTNSQQNPLAEKPIADAAVQHHHFTMPDILNQPALHRRMNPSHPTKVTSLEVGMYVLLAAFGVAIVVFATSFVVYTWRFKPGTIMRPHSGMGRKGSVGLDSVTNAHDWVWLGRATLERASGIGQSPSAQGLSTGNIPLCDLNDNEKLPTWRDYHRFSQIDAEAGSNPVNITNNPGAETDMLLNDEEETSLCDSSTFTKSSAKFPRKVTFNNLNSDLAQDFPPAPPLRNMGISAKLAQKFRHQYPNQVQPPPIPPHGINVIDNPFDPQQMLEKTLRSQEQLIVQQKEEEVDQEDKTPPKFVEVNADDFVRLRGVTRSRAAQVRRATILENPLLSAALPENLNITDHLDNLPPTMDYEQLLTYFSNLKESNA